MTLSAALTSVIKAEQEAEIVRQANDRGKKLGAYLAQEAGRCAYQGIDADEFLEVPAAEDPTPTVSARMGTSYTCDRVRIDMAAGAVPWVRGTQPGDVCAHDPHAVHGRPRMVVRTPVFNNWMGPTTLWLRRQDDVMVPIPEADLTDQNRLWDGWDVDGPEAAAHAWDIPEDNEIGKDQEEFEHMDAKSMNAYLLRYQSGDWHKLPFKLWMLPTMGTSQKACGTWWTDIKPWSVEGCVGPPADDTTPAADLAREAHAGVGWGVARRRDNSCKKLRCMICIEKAISRAANRAVDKMEAYILFMQSNMFPEGGRRIYNHFIVSPGRDKYVELQDEKALKKYEARIYRELARIGVQGGMVIFHPFRFTKRLGKPYWSPHWHFLLAGYTKSDDIVQAYRRTGAVYRSIATLQTRADAMGVTSYLLSHAGVQAETITRRHVVRYFGGANNRHFSVGRPMLSMSSEIDAQQVEVAETLAWGKGIRKGKEDVRIVEEVQIAKGVMDVDRDVAQTAWTAVDVIRREDMPSGSTDELQAAIMASMKASQPAYDKDNLAIGPIAPPKEGEEAEQAAAGARRPMWLMTRVKATVKPAVPTAPLPGGAPNTNQDMGRTVVRYACWFIDPGTTQLCPICARRVRPLILNDLSDLNRPDIQAKTEDDSEGAELPFTLIGLRKWHYRTREDVELLGGVPYYQDDMDKVQYDEGLAVKNPHYRGMPDDARAVQRTAIQSTVRRKLIRDCKARAAYEHRAARGEEMAAYIQAYWAKFEHMWVDTIQQTL